MRMRPKVKFRAGLGQVLGSPEDVRWAWGSVAPLWRQRLFVVPHCSFTKMCNGATLLSMEFTVGMIEMTHIILTINLFKVLLIGVGILRA